MTQSGNSPPPSDPLLLDPTAQASIEPTTPHSGPLLAGRWCKPAGGKSVFATFLAAFSAVFIAEVGDKTQLAVLLMAAETGQPLTVFVGAALALLATSVLGVLLGRWLAGRLSPTVLETVVGGILLAVAVGLLWEVVMA